jgi:polyhydroxyalkanoate synthesis regulator phasin
VVTVFTPAQGAARAIMLVEMLLADGKINGGNANSLTSKLEGTQKALENGNVNAASGKLGAVLNELDAMVRSGRVTEDDISALRSLVRRLQESISP